ncbi:MAG: TIGR03545 family protein [Nitrospirota bacterium]|nr:TIGR03545 family protein [Nitrospirota bacterium]
MNKWIRWWGLIAFAAFCGLIIIFWLFFVDGFVRNMVERAGSAAAGAEVNVSSARLTISPLGIALSGIQVTDPKVPSTNSLEIGRVAFSLDGLNLLRRKIIIQEMSADGLLFGTARKKPGFVILPDTPAVQEKKTSSFALPSFAIPDVKQILQTEVFESVKLIDDANADVQKTAASWQKRMSELPSKSSLDSYRTRLDKLKISSRSSLKDLTSASLDAKKIKEDLDRDLERLKSSKTALSADLASLKELVAKAERAPLEDIRRIRDKYSISPSGLQNMSQALFGSKVVSWFDSGLVWYNRITPLIAGSGEGKGTVKVSKPLRGKGVDVRFREHAPLPDFLIRNVNTSMKPEAGSFAGTIRNITPDQDIIGIPLTFKFDGSGMKDLRTITLSGGFDHILSASYKDTIQVEVLGYRAGDMVLSGNKELPITLQDGLMDLEFKGLRTSKGLSATLSATFRSVRINTGNQGNSGMILSSLRSALSRVTAFKLSADISGEPGNYDVKVSSDLDRVFKDAVGRMVQEQSVKLEKDLKAAVQAKTEGKVKDLKASLGGLNTAGANIDAVQNELNTLLQEAKQKAEGKVKLSL